VRASDLLGLVCLLDSVGCRVHFKDILGLSRTDIPIRLSMSVRIRVNPYIKTSGLYIRVNLGLTRGAAGERHPPAE